MNIDVGQDGYKRYQKRYNYVVRLFVYVIDSKRPGRPNMVYTYIYEYVFLFKITYIETHSAVFLTEKESQQARNHL